MAELARYKQMGAGPLAYGEDAIVPIIDTAVVVCGVCVKIQNVVTVGVHGIDNGLITIVAYNYGAKKRVHINEAIK